MSKEQSYDVFLSYSSKDKSWASALVSELKRAGVSAWSDEEIAPGERWADKLEEALRKSRAFVILLGPDSGKSPWTFFELGAAVADNKIIIPVATGDIDIHQWPLPLRQYQFLQESSPEKAGRRIADVLNEYSDEKS